jgi:hypothetical protein
VNQLAEAKDELLKRVMERAAASDPSPHVPSAEFFRAP